MKALDLLKQNRPPNILLYGPAGTGKTALVSQLSGAYMFDFDRGMRTAAKLEDRFSRYRRSIEFEEYWDENIKKPSAFLRAKKKLIAISDNCRNKNWPFNGCVVDSLTGACNACQLYAMGLGDKSNPQGDPLAKPEIQNWGTMVNAIEGFLTILRSLNVITIVTAHVNIEEIDEKNTLFPLSITKKHGSNKLMWLFDEVWYADTRPGAAGSVRYRVTAQPTASIKTRTRAGMKSMFHNDIGLTGLLEEVGFKYEHKVKDNSP